MQKTKEIKMQAIKEKENMFAILCGNSSFTKYQTFAILRVFGLFKDVFIAQSEYNIVSNDKITKKVIISQW
jgi:hypothetical protein